MADYEVAYMPEEADYEVAYMPENDILLAGETSSKQTPITLTSGMRNFKMKMQKSVGTLWCNFSHAWRVLRFKDFIGVSLACIVCFFIVFF